MAFVSDALPCLAAGNAKSNLAITVPKTIN